MFLSSREFKVGLGYMNKTMSQKGGHIHVGSISESSNDEMFIMSNRLQGHGAAEGTLVASHNWLDIGLGPECVCVWEGGE